MKKKPKEVIAKGLSLPRDVAQREQEIVDEETKIKRLEYV